MKPLNTKDEIVTKGKGKILVHQEGLVQKRKERRNHLKIG